MKVYIRKSYERVNRTNLVFHCVRKSRKPLTARQIYRKLQKSGVEFTYSDVVNKVMMLSGRNLVNGMRRDELIYNREDTTYSFNPEGTIRVKSPKTAVSLLGVKIDRQSK